MYGNIPSLLVYDIKSSEQVDTLSRIIFRLIGMRLFECICFMEHILKTTFSLFSPIDINCNAL